MADRHVNSISLKALVDTVKNKVIFAESDEDFIDVLFSFLTLPMGTIVKLTRTHLPASNIGCMNNLYKSVEDFDMQRLHTEACKTMLLSPQSVAETHCRSLKLKFDDSEPTRYFLCSTRDCSSKSKLLSHHMGALCGCGGTMSREINLSNIGLKKSVSAVQDRGVFVKGLTQLFISDDLKVKPSSPEASLSLLSDLGFQDGSTIEERTYNVGVEKVLNLLKCSLVSKTPLTDTLLNQNPVNQILPQLMEPGAASTGGGKICAKIMVSKSKKVVCYAEAGEDFVDLLISFLTLPLGYIVKKMQRSISKGCIDNLYASVKDLDAEQYMKSDEHKAMLVSPKVPSRFRYENQPLDIEEALHPTYFLGQWLLLNSGFIEERLTTDEMLGPNCQNSGIVLTVMDPKSHFKEAKKGRGFVQGPAMFTVTDSLVIKTISPVSGISLLKEMKVPFSDVEQRIVRVGIEEALRLLVASFITESALTSAFIATEPKQE